MSEAVFKLVHPPTAISNCLRATITHKSANNLVVISGNTLRIYDILEEDGTVNLASVGSFELSGQITGVEAVRFKDFDKDCLLIAFFEAKMSVVEFDEASFDFRTITLHYFEDDSLKDGKTEFFEENLLRVSPSDGERQCASMLVYDSKLIVVPFAKRKDIYDFDQEEEQQLPVERHSMLDLNSLGIKNVKDYCFLKDYYEPTVAFLHEPEQTWSGRAALKRYTCNITAVTLSTRSTIWNATSLPYDSYKLIPLFNPLGGVLAISLNGVFHVNQKTHYGISLNDMLTPDPELPVMLDETSQALTLEDLSHAFLSSQSLLISVRPYSLYIMNLITEGQVLRHVEFREAEIEDPIFAACMAPVSRNMIFLGSCEGDSLLCKIVDKAEASEKQADKERVKMQGLIENSLSKEEEEEKEDEPKEENQEQDSNIGSSDEKEKQDTEEAKAEDSQLYRHNHNINASQSDEPTHQDNKNDQVKENANELKNANQNQSDNITNGKDRDADQEDENNSVAMKQEEDKTANSEINIDIENNDRNNIKEEEQSNDKQDVEMENSELKDEFNSIFGGGDGEPERKRRRVMTKHEEEEKEKEKDDGVDDYKNKEQKVSIKDEQSGQDEKEEHGRGSNSKSEDRVDEVMEDEAAAILFGGGEASEPTQQQAFKHHPHKVWDGEYILEVHEAFLNLGPVIDICAGLPSVSTRRRHERQADLVMCSGHHKTGSVHIMHRGVRPARLGMSFSVQLPPVKGLFFVNNQDGNTDHDEDDQSYLLISLETGKTKVISVGQELRDASGAGGFIKSSPTIAAGQMMSKFIAVQICPHLVRIVHNRTVIQDLKIRRHHAVKADITDRYIAILLEDGSLLMLRPTDISTETSPRFKLFSPPTANRKDTIGSMGSITATSLFKDTTGAFRKIAGGDAEYYCIICRRSGSLEIYTVPAFECVFSLAHFSELPNVISDHRDELNTESSQSDVYVRDVMLTHIDSQDNPISPYLLAVMNTEQLVAYKSFSYPKTAQQSDSQDNHSSAASRLSSLRFRYQELDTFTHNRERYHASFNVGQKDTEESPSIQDEIAKRPDLRPFTDIGGVNGVFLCGEHPCWIVSQRGELRIHPMSQDTATSFTELHGMAEEDVFMFGNENGDLVTCRLPPDVEYRNYWPVKRVSLRATPHNVTYHADTKTYTVVVSQPTPLQYGENEEPMPEGRYPQPTEDRYELRLYNEKWRHMDTFHLQEQEAVLGTSIVPMSKDNTEMPEEVYYDPKRRQVWEAEHRFKRQTVPLVAVGTGYEQGEDVSGKGRVLLFDLEPNAKDMKSLKLKLIGAKDVKGPVSAVAPLDGYIIVAVGPKIFVYYFDWENGQVIPASFFDSNFYIVSMSTLKDYVLFGDIFKSIYMLRWRENGHSLRLLSKDFDPLEVYATEYLVHGDVLSLLVSDQKRNIQIFSYSPHKNESRGGQRLVCEGDFHADVHINKFLRLCMPKGDKTNRHYTMFGTFDGAVGFVAPVDETRYRRLAMLVRKMYMNLPHRAGLHPKAYRLFRPSTKRHNFLRKNILDGALLWRFAHLEKTKQKELAKMIGSLPDRIMSDILDLTDSTAIF